MAVGIVLGQREEYRPKPRVDGISAEVSIPDRNSYDYWALKVNGDFFLLQSLFEDMLRSNSIFFNTRIVRATEALVYCQGLYSHLGLGEDTIVAVRLAHQGLKGRKLTTSSPNRIVFPETTTEDRYETTITVRLGAIHQEIVDNVIRLTEPLFMLFNFKEFQRGIYAEIVTDFLAGRAI